MQDSVAKCEICHKPAQKSCASCHQVYYCSKEHQKDGWKKHKKLCRPFKICENEELGRFLIATRSINQGDIILKEAPLVWGPAQHTIPICLGCGKAINSNSSRPCYKCGWPVCGELCEKSPAHLPECRYAAQRGKVTIKNFEVTHPLYQFVIILRCLYQKQFLPKAWKKLSILESHDEPRKQTKKYEDDRNNIAQFIRSYFKLGSTFTDEDILTICGIVAVNSHEVPLTDPSCIAIFEVSSMFQHDCAANCMKSFTNDGHILITAARKIEKNENLSICYADALWGTQPRRQFLNETKFFWCQCQRCQDPTEFGTYFSALKCQKSECVGFLLPKNFLHSDKYADWSCNVCQQKVLHNSIIDTLEQIGSDLINLDKTDFKELQKFLKNYQEYLPDNHYYLTEIKYELSQILGQSQGLSCLSSEELIFKIKLCRELIELLPKIAPSERRLLGTTFFELHAGLAESAGRVTGDAKETRKILIQSKTALEESIECLKHEPDVLPEGKVCAQAKINLEELNNMLD